MKIYWICASCDASGTDYYIWRDKIIFSSSEAISNACLPACLPAFPRHTQYNNKIASTEGIVRARECECKCETYTRVRTATTIYFAYGTRSTGNIFFYDFSLLRRVTLFPYSFRLFRFHLFVRRWSYVSHDAYCAISATGNRFRQLNRTRATEQVSRLVGWLADGRTSDWKSRNEKGAKMYLL